MCYACCVLDMFMLHGVNIFSILICEQVELWFTGQQELENPQDPDVPPIFDRQGKLKNVSHTYKRMFTEVFSCLCYSVLCSDSMT